MGGRLGFLRLYVLFIPPLKRHPNLLFHGVGKGVGKRGDGKRVMRGEG